MCGSIFCTDHLMTCQLFPAEARVPPIKPPIYAWLELVGNPSHQVKRFHIIPANIAQRIVRLVT